MKQRMTTEEIEQKRENAVRFFENGYNCAQSVLLAYAGRYGIDELTAMKMASSFGGGMGRMREVCGAVTGMLMVLGLEYPFTDTTDRQSKNRNYQVVQECMNEFKTNTGSFICADLLNLKREAQKPESSERDQAFYRSRPCAGCVALAANIIGRKILENQ